MKKVSSFIVIALAMLCNLLPAYSQMYNDIYTTISSFAASHGLSSRQLYEELGFDEVTLIKYLGEENSKGKSVSFVLSEMYNSKRHDTRSIINITATKLSIGAPGLAWDVILTSHQDRLTIRHIELNRQNCHAQTNSQPPYLLNFGQKLVLRMFDCDPIELFVQADEGDATIEFTE